MPATRSLAPVALALALAGVIGLMVSAPSEVAGAPHIRQKGEARSERSATPALEALAEVPPAQDRAPVSIAAAEGSDAAPLAPRATATIQVLLPRGLVAAELVEVFAWPEGNAFAPKRAEASADGQCVIDDLAPATWTFTARASAGERSAWGTTEPQSLVDGSSLALALPLAEYVVEGIVTDAQGLVLADVPLRLESSALGPLTHSGAGEVEYWSDVAAALLEARVTADAAKFGLEGASQFELSFDLEEVNAAVTTGQVEQNFLDDVESETVQFAHFVVAGGTPIRFDDFGDGTASTPKGPIDLRTGPDGRYRAWLPGPSRVSVTAPVVSTREDEPWQRYRSQSENAELSADSPRATVDLALVRPARVEGSVAAPPRDGEQKVLVFVHSRGDGRTTSAAVDEHGRYAIGNLMPGEVIVYARSGGARGQSVAACVALDVAPSETRIVHLALHASSSVTGEVVRADGSPADSVRLTARAADDPTLVRQARTDSEGRFTIVGMYGSRYGIVVEGEALAEPVHVTVAAGGAVVNAGTLRLAPAKPAPSSD